MEDSICREFCKAAVSDVEARLLIKRTSPEFEESWPKNKSDSV